MLYIMEVYRYKTDTIFYIYNKIIFNFVLDKYYYVWYNYNVRVNIGFFDKRG